MKLSQLTDRWNVLGVIATAVCTCIGGFVVLPPIDYGKDNWSHFGVFLVTIVVGLWSVPVTLWVSRRAMSVWIIAAIAFVALGAFSYFSYDEHMGLWKFEYSGQREIAGDQLTVAGQEVANELLRAGRSANNHDIAWEMGSDFAATWSDDGSRERRMHCLIELYLFQLLLFASAVVTVTQASFCVANSHKQHGVKADETQSRS